MSAIGFYPVCPGSGEYVTVMPLFKKVTVEGSKQLVIEPSTWQAGKFWRQGEFFDESDSELDRGEEITAAPVFGDWRQRFDGERQVELKSIYGNGSSKIYYTLDGSDPDTNATLYSEPFRVDKDIEIRAVAYNPATGYSNVVSQRLTQFKADKKLSYVTEPNPQYYENGAEGLVDRLYGEQNYRIGGWQGWQGDMEVVIDLMETKPVNAVGVSCLEDTKSWIFFPTEVEASVSDDGKEYKPFGKADTGYEPLADPAGHKAMKKFEVKGHTKARYVKLKVKNFGKMPSWHVSAGEQAWLFIDEVEVE
jgi:hypothetical protein